LLGTKADLVDHSNSQVTFDSVISVIESECAGIDELMALISQRLDQQVERTEGLIGTTSARCRETLRETEDAMANAIDAAEQRAGDELIALELRSALDGLGQVLGLLHSDDILDRIFSKFCIGK
jgi:tRNA modification GTPase